MHDFDRIMSYAVSRGIVDPFEVVSWWSQEWTEEEMVNEIKKRVEGRR